MRKNSKTPSGPTLANDLSNVVVETAVQVARKLLFINAGKKALAHFVLVFVVSLYAHYFPPNDDFYFAKRNNVFNLYGTKVGWFWTLITVGPFIWTTAYLQNQNSSVKAIQHLVRLIVATGIWYFITNSFIYIEKITSRCQGAKGSGQHECSLANGKWIPGIDLSGHCFLLIYNILILCEESFGYKNWPRNPTNSTTRIATPVEAQNYKKLTLSVQGLFIILFVFHIFWDFQLLVTCCYYHTLNHKILGAAVAIIAWFVTYKVVFPYFPGLPHFHVKRS